MTSLNKPKNLHPHAQYCNGIECEFYRPSYFRVVDNGTYYYPAWKHYGKLVSVVCDRCGKSNLKACVGLGQLDLCMICIDELTRGVSYLSYCDS